MAVPSETDVLRIRQAGEDQLHEFKGQGTDARKIAKEAAAMLHSPEGGIVLYGVDDDGTIQGTDISRQQLDQSVQNAVRNSIAPAPSIRLAAVEVLGTDVIAVIVPPWNHKDVYQYEGRVCVRKGTNVFYANPEEARRLHDGKPIG